MNSPRGFCSTDKKPDALADFCNRYKIPYSKEFVPAWVMPAHWSQVKQIAGGRSTWIPRNADVYGKDIILLGEHVVDCLAIVACGDFRNIILQAIRLEEAGKAVESYVEEMPFVFTPTMPRDERIGALQRASAKARQLIKLGDAEARLLRRLRDSDTQNP